MQTCTIVVQYVVIRDQGQSSSRHSAIAYIAHVCIISCKEASCKSCINSRPSDGGASGIVCVASGALDRQERPEHSSTGW